MTLAWFLKDFLRLILIKLISFQSLRSQKSNVSNNLQIIDKIKKLWSWQLGGTKVSFQIWNGDSKNLT